VGIVLLKMINKVDIVEELKKQFLVYSTNLIGDLDKIIIQEMAKDKTISLVEYSDKILINLNHGRKGKSMVHYGFPIPSSSEQLDYVAPYGQEVNIFFRGQNLRDLQRFQLEKLSDKFETINGQENFEELIQRKVIGKKRIVYIDPYDFIGDSFNGIEFLDSFKKKFKLEDYLFFSRQSEHLVKPLDVREFNLESISNSVQGGDLVLMPDFMDNHWSNTLVVIDSMVSSPRQDSVDILIPGRNLLIELEKGKMISYHFNDKDLFLENSNIGDFYRRCVKPFGVELIGNLRQERYEETSTFFINPFANHVLRYLPVEIIFNVYKSISEKNLKSKFNLICGYHHKREHFNWVSHFLDLLNGDGDKRRVSLKYYCNLTELIEDMEKSKCSAIISSDTSIAHMANRLGYPNITIYNTQWWDYESVQSLAGSSPLGFCRFFPTQIPAINNGRISTYCKLSENIADAMLFLEQNPFKISEIIDKYLPDELPKTQKEYFQIADSLQGTELSWASSIYNPRILTHGIESSIHGPDLIMTSLKVSPIYKLIKLKK